MIIYWLINSFIKLTGWIAYALYFRAKVYYEDRKVQGRRIKGKAIVISNHHAVIDFALMMYLFPFRVLRCQVAEILYQKNIFMTFLLKILGCIKVDRYSHDFSFMEKTAKILRRKGVVQVFPEARIPLRNEQKPLPFKVSVVSTALETDTKIIPVYNDGRRKGRCRVIIGKPVNVRDWYDEKKTEKENLAIITDKLREKVVLLKNELQTKEEMQNRK